MVNQYLPPSPVIPKSLLITAISNSNPMQVTVEEENSYVVGQLVILTVPYSYRMFQANGLTLKIISIDGLNFFLDIDSTGFDTFVIPGDGQEQPASLAPAGSRNLYNVTEVPFHSQGNIGN